MRLKTALWRYFGAMNNFINPYQNNAIYGPLPFQVQQPQTPAQQLVKVSGLDGAKAYQMPPNSAAALFHESEDLFYVKTTDGAGFPTIRAFRFEPLEEPAAKTVEVEKYVTIDEFEAFKKEVLNAKQSVRKPS